MRRRIDPNGRYCAYLRKSRDDRDERGNVMTVEETLRKHESWIVELAIRHGIRVEKWYREVVSAETIDARPEVQQVLRELAEGKWDGVLCVDVQRLARGDTKDQGIMCEFLEVSGALVITTDGYFDTTDEADMDYLEYGLFRSRQEYKAINKILKRGRKRSKLDGNWPFSVAPYGYVKVRDEIGPTLAHGDCAKYVVIVDELSAQGLSFGSIARRMVEIGAPGEWSATKVRRIVTNEAYLGRTPVEKFVVVKRMKADGSGLEKVSIPVKDPQYRPGRHDPIVTQELFDAANANRCNPSLKKSNELRNPLASLLVCSGCGFAMRMIKDSKTGMFRYYHSMKPNGCSVKSCGYDLMMDAVIAELKRRIDDSRVEVRQRSDRSAEREIAAMKESLAVVDRSLASLLDRLMREVVTEDEYMAMKRKLSDEKQSLEATLAAAEADRERETSIEHRNVTIHQAIDILRSDATAGEANAFLRTFIERIEYSNDGVGLNVHNIKLDIFFK